MTTTAANYRAAWVPDNDPPTFFAGADLAAEWVEEQAADLGVPVILVTNTFSGATVGGALHKYNRTRHHVTPRSDGGGLRGAVVAYVPLPPAVELAMTIAEGLAVCMVETESNPLRGWARSLGAVDLVAGTTLQPAAAEVERYLERIEFHSNNGFTRGFGADTTLDILGQMKAAGVLDRVGVLGHFASRGMHSKALDRLAKLIDKS